MYLSHINQNNEQLYGGHMMDYVSGSSWMPVVWMVLWFALVVAAIIALLSYVQAKQKDSDPLSTLKNRYAKGEIDKKEYESIKKDISEK